MVTTHSCVTITTNKRPTTSRVVLLAGHSLGLRLLYCMYPLRQRKLQPTNQPSSPWLRASCFMLHASFRAQHASFLCFVLSLLIQTKEKASKAKQRPALSSILSDLSCLFSLLLPRLPTPPPHSQDPPPSTPHHVNMYVPQPHGREKPGWNARIIPGARAEKMARR